MARDTISPNVPGLDTSLASSSPSPLQPLTASPVTTRTTRFSNTLAAGGVIAALVDPFGSGSTFATAGTVPAQLALSGGNIVRGNGAVVVGSEYSIWIVVTSPDGVPQTPVRLTFRAVLPLGGVGTVTPPSTPALTATPATKSIAANVASGTLLFAIGNVPAGVTPTVSPNDGRFAIAGDGTNGWKVVTGLSALSAGSVNVSANAAGATSVVVPVTITAVAALAGFARNGAANSLAKSAISRVQAGTGRGKIVFKGDSTTAGEGTGTAVNGYALGGARNKRTAFTMATALRAAGVMARDSALYGDNGMGISNAASLVDYDARVTNFINNAASATAWGRGTGQTFAGGAVLAGTSAAMTFTPEFPCDTFEIVFYNNDNGLMTFLIDGVAPASGPATLQLASTQNGFTKATIKAASVGTHTLSVSSNGTGLGLVRSILPYDSTVSALDVLVHAVRGAKAADQSANTGSQQWVNNFALAYDAPDLTIINCGLNNMAGGVAVSAYTSALQIMITTAKATGDVLLVFPHPAGSIGSLNFNQNVAAFLSAASQLAVSNGISFFSLYDYFGGNVPATADNVHPTAATADTIGKAYQQAIAAMVA